MTHRARIVNAVVSSCRLPARFRQSSNGTVCSAGMLPRSHLQPLRMDVTDVEPAYLKQGATCSHSFDRINSVDTVGRPAGWMLIGISKASLFASR